MNDQLEAIDLMLARMNDVYAPGKSFPFYRYDRQALAEMIIQRTDRKLSSLSYVDFRRLFDSPDPSVRTILQPAIEFARYLGALPQGEFQEIRPYVEELMNQLSGIASEVGKRTRLASSIPGTTTANGQTSVDLSSKQGPAPSGVSDRTPDRSV